jgi:tripartite-type tricarboxylate transporter receptor subunit TctC
MLKHARFSGFCAIFAATLLQAKQPVEAQTPIYKGKQVRMVIASGPGGGYDAYGRILARYLEKHIPGNPSFINQNMPGAAGMTAMNWAYNIAPKDGTVILATYNTLLAQPLYGDPTVQYDMLKYEIVGSFSKQQNVCVTWHTSPIKTLAQTMGKELTVSATGVTGDSATMPRILNGLLGTKFKPVMGYETTEARLALERGEVDGICGLSWSTLKASAPDWVQEKRVNILIQTGASAQKGLEDVPLLRDLVKADEDRKVVDFLSFPQEMGRPFIMPPGTPKDTVLIIRRAFDAALRDPEMQAESAKQSLEIDPIKGEDMERQIKDAYALPKSIVKRAADLTGVEIR